MKTFAIDVGNTSTHYGLVEGETVHAAGEVPTRTFADGASRAFASLVEPLVRQADGIAFCSVVPAINTHLVASVEKLGRPVFHLTHGTCRGLPLTYPKPSEIGQDRLANALAAQAFHGTPAIVIDMGTAVTFDILSASGGYEGGIIAPGLGVMTRYLHEQTALLPALDEKELVRVEGAIGKSTVHAMKLGCVIGFSGMIDALLKRITAELKERGEADPVVLATGGSMANLTREWTGKSRFVEHLTLQGLGVALARNLSAGPGA